MCMKRFMSLFIVLCLVITMVPVVASANGAIVDSGMCGENVSWVLDENGVLTISGTGSIEWYSSKYSCPWYSLNSSIKTVKIEEGVTSVGSFAFYDCDSLTCVELSNSIESIGSYAFYDCDGLTSMDIPDSVLDIFNHAFPGCGNLTGFHVSENNSAYSTDLHGVLFNKDKSSLIQAPGALAGHYDIPDSVDDVLWSAFYDCDSLTSVTIPNSVRNLVCGAFESCDSLTSVMIPESVETIYSDVFAYCSNLTGIHVSENNPYYSSDTRGVLFNKDKTEIMQAPGALTGSYLMPDSVMTIWSSAFKGCGSLTGVTIADSVTKIDEETFSECSSLTSVIIPDNVTTIGRWAFLGCSSLRSVTIPDSVISLGPGAFYRCSSLLSVRIPDSVTTIGDYAFFMCTDLENVTFCGNAPAMEDSVFWDVTAIAYYPAGNETWTEDVMQDYGGTITWVPYDAGTEPDTEPTHDKMSELTDFDYLLFSEIVYTDGISQMKGKTVAQFLDSKWTKEWNNTGITYQDAYGPIRNWKIHKIFSYDNGFFAVEFLNSSNEAVVSFCGSRPLNLDNIKDHPWDVIQDWIANDLTMQILDLVGPQVTHAIYTYIEVVMENPADIKFTGHSLGGALADIASAYSGYEAISFNSISALDVAYFNYPHEMGKMFQGVDQWNFIDHTNEKDIIAGMFEEHLEIYNPPIKPYIPHSNNGKASNIAEYHGLSSIVKIADNGKAELTREGSPQIPKSALTRLMLHDPKKLDMDLLLMGTSGDDKFLHGMAAMSKVTAFGGNGHDDITGSILTDVLVGGKGNDHLDGDYLDDTYIYYKGDGHDFIRDISGDDALYLYGFDSSDVIKVVDIESINTIDITCNGEEIVSIYKLGREYSGINLKSFKVHIQKNGMMEVHDITQYFSTKKHGSRILVSCPVSVEVLDPDGNVVYTLEDGAVGNYYTDYGNFYVFEEDDGGYGKALNLVEGYTARIVGEDAGTMDITYQDVADGALTEAKIVTDVPVSESTTATIQQSEDGKLVLAVDTDNDGVTDVETAFMCAENHNYENGFCTECGKAAPTAKFTTISTSLGGNIAMNFYLELSEDLVSDPDAYIQFTYAGKTLNVPLSEGVLSGGVYRFACPITSKNMTDEITAQVYNGSGPVGGSKTMDVATYCNWVIDNYTDAKTVNLMKAMLNYGASAQLLFKYRTDDLANAALAEADKVLGKVDASAYIHSRTGEEEGIKPTTYTLLLDSETTVRVYFQLTGDKAIDEYTFTVDGVEVTPVYKDGLYYIQKTDIGAHRLDELHFFTCGNITIRYGGLSYVNQVMTYYTEGTTFDMASALFAYSKAAEAYIG